MKVAATDDRFKGKEREYVAISYTVGSRGHGAWFTLDHELKPSAYRKFPRELQNS
jgi:hypothetical protein